MHLESNEKLEFLVASLIQGIKRLNVIISLQFNFTKVDHKVTKDQSMLEHSIVFGSSSAVVRADTVSLNG